MAIVYIIPIRSRLDRTLSYVGNKLKTENKNYEEADKIRNQLLEMGIVIKDTKDGTIFEIKK